MKKVLALVLVAVIVVLSTVTVGATAILYGDANGDKAINNRDVARLQQYLNGWDVKLGPDTTTTTVAVVRPPAEIPEDEMMSLEAAAALGLSMEEGTDTEEKYYVRGTITVIHNNHHGVVEIEDALGNRLTVYGIDFTTADNHYGFYSLLPQPKVGDTVTVQGVIGRHNGVAQMSYANIVEHNGNAPDYYHASTGSNTTVVTPIQLPLVSDQAKILEDIATLRENEYLPYIAILTGKVLQVETRTDMDIQYGRVTLTFKVGDVTLECYQMKGNGTDKVKAGDTITVRGVIRNYYYEGATKGKLEFAWHEASGTEVTLTKLVAAAVQDLSTEAKILEAAQALKDGESLSKEVSLTGKVVDIETPYDASFENVTLNFTVGGVKIKCYRLKGNGVDKVKEGDTITVSGTIKNYQGIIEFDTGCQMTKRVAGTATTKTMKKVTAPKTDTAYKFGMVQENVNKDAVYYLAGGMSATYYFATTTSANAAIDVYLEAVSGGYHLYTMIDGKKTYINMVQSGTYINGKYQDTASTVYTFDEELKTIVGVFDGQKYVFGTYTEKNGAPSKYTTVGGYRPDGAFYCQFYEEA